MAGEAVSKTVVPKENVVAQTPGQEIPAGELITVPLPLTVTVSVSGTAVNVALTLWAPDIVTVQAPVPEHGPDQPEKVYPVEGEAKSVTEVPRGNVVTQLPGQEIPAGELVTAPLPLTLTVSVCGGPNCTMETLNLPDDPKSTNKLAERVSPVF